MTMRLSSIFGMLVLMMLTGCSGLSQSKPTYTMSAHHSAQLSSPDRDHAYLTGQGMGYAQIADSNHYPGPRHVLDLADELQLTQQQKQDSQTLFEQMQKDASELGEKLVAKEKIFHHLFRTGRMNDDTLALLLTEMSILETKIRYVHLGAHLKQQALLTPEQIARYDTLRGYVPQSAEHQHH